MKYVLCFWKAVFCADAVNVTKTALSSDTDTGHLGVFCSVSSGTCGWFVVGYGGGSILSVVLSMEHSIGLGSGELTGT